VTLDQIRAIPRCRDLPLRPDTLSVPQEADEEAAAAEAAAARAAAKDPGGVAARAPLTAKQADRVFVEMLWSDPMAAQGTATSDRGAGVRWGPDVTERFCKANGVDMIVRRYDPSTYVLYPLLTGVVLSRSHANLLTHSLTHFAHSCSTCDRSCGAATSACRTATR